MKYLIIVLTLILPLIVYASSGEIDLGFPDQIPSQTGNSGKFLSTDGTMLLWSSGGSGSGTVTSVDALVPSYMSISGGPITTAGTLSFDFNAQSGNKVFASPANGSSGAMSMRALVSLDIPALSYVANVTGTAPIVSSGGLTPAISIPAATNSVDGYLTAADRTTFAAKQAAGNYITDLTGDVTASGPGSVSATVVKIQGVSISTVVPTDAQILTYNSSNSKWEARSPATSGTVTSIVSGAGLISGTISNTGTITVDLGTAANKVLQVTSGGQYPAIDGYLIDNVNAKNIQGITVLSNTPTSGQVLTYNNTVAKWQPLTPTVYVSSVSGTPPIVSSGGLAPAISITQSTTSADGYLSSTDWNTFNSKQSAGNYITALTGDVIASGPGSVAAAVVALQGFSIVTNTPTAGQYLGWNATITKWQPLTVTTGTVTSVVAGTGLVANTITSTGTLAVDVGTVANKILQITSGGQYPAVDGFLITNLNAANKALSNLANVAINVDLNLNTHKLTNVVDPASAQDGATKNYVDTVASGLQPIEAVYAASTANIVGTYLNGVACVGATFTVTATGALSLDGTSPPQGSRILLKNQSSGFQNGVYDVTLAGSVGVSPILTRSLDYNTATDMNAGSLVPVINGTANAITTWLQTATISTCGSDSLVFTEWSYNPANFLLKANNLSDVASASTSFNNLSPMTASGDIIYGGTSGAGTRLAKGSDSQVLTLASGLPTWATPATGSVTSVVSGTGLVAGTITTTGTLNVDVGTAASKIVQLTAAAKYPAVDGNLITNINATSNISGILPIANGGTGAATLTAANILFNGGNSFAGNATVGTNDNYTLGFKTNNSTRMTIIPSGAVGIGTPTPQAKLQVLAGTILLDNGFALQGYATGGTVVNLIDVAGTILTLGDAGIYSAIKLFPGNSTPGMTILSSGNVGIGTITPNSLLDVAGTVRATNLCNTTGANCAFLNNGNAFAANATLGTTDNYELNFVTNNTRAVNISAAGNISIGTAPSSQAAAITVSGQSSSGIDLNGANMTYTPAGGTGFGSSGDFIVSTAGSNSGAAGVIGIDAPATTQSGFGTTSINWSHTVGSNSSRVLIVSVGYAGISNRISSVTFGAAPLTKFASTGLNGTARNTDLWYLLAPSSGAGTITVTTDGTSLNLGAVAASFYNVDQTNTFGTAVTLGSGATAMTINATATTAYGEWVLSTFEKLGSAETPTADSPATQVGAVAGGNGGAGSWAGLSYYAVPSGTTSQQLGWTWTTTNRSAALIVVSMRPSGSTNANVATERMRVTSTGRVGIGTSTPETMLEVDGKFHLGTAGTIIGSMGICTIASTAWTTAAITGNACTGMPSAAAYVFCSPETPRTGQTFASIPDGAGTVTIVASTTGTTKLDCFWVRP